MEDARNLESFCREEHIRIGANLRQRIDTRQQTVLELMNNLTRWHKRSVPGAKALLEKIARFNAMDPSAESRFDHTVTEALSLSYVEKHLGGTITRIEAGKSRVLSPHRKPKREDPDPDKEPSCDFAAMIDGDESFFDAKDNYLWYDRSHKSGPSGFQPPSRDQIQTWLRQRVRRHCFRKGANYLVARISVGSRLNPVPMERLLMWEVFNRENLKPDDLVISVDYEVPNWFTGIFLVKPEGHLFLRVQSNRCTYE